MENLENKNIELKIRFVGLINVCGCVCELKEEGVRNDKLSITFPKLRPTIDVVCKVEKTLEFFFFKT